MNVHKVGTNVLLAICDVELVGRTLRKGKIVFCVKESFYKGVRLSASEAATMIKNSFDPTRI
jgi:hypothetical protein